MSLFGLEKILFQEQSGDEPVQVIERNGRRELRFGNHITQSAISLSDPDHLLLDYTRAMVAGFLFAPQARAVLHVGLGAGSLARFIHRHFPQVDQTIVEVSPVVIEVAHRHFGLPESPRLNVVEGAGEEFLAAHAGAPFELIFLDAFRADGVPKSLETEPFFQTVDGRLGPNGWLVNNVWGSDPINLHKVAQSLGRVFKAIYSVSVRQESNVIFFASNAPSAVVPGELLHVAGALAERVPVDLVGYAQQLMRGGQALGGRGRFFG